ncbi:MAG: uroporphyrin-III C-methyltransferase/precorrin-2 dehydrogenase/sirohydrochlorin ferrochelatase [Halocynthiibacter sp.]|jgi:uroporphyrin-III C-methyltransferase/precorrin-2 dehydrogenase/sirohydrochlorin ferrochelatase
MKFFPMFLRVAERDVLIIGGGEQAAQKARLMLKTEARISFLAPLIDDELAALVEEGRARHDAGPITPDRLRGAALVFIGSGCPGHDAAIHALAREAGVVVNVVDQPALCEATTPSIVDRDPLVIAIGTEGAAPVLARQIKTRMEEILEPRLGELVGLAGRLRGAVAQHVARPARRGLWRWVFAGDPRRLHARGAEREAAEQIKSAILSGSAPNHVPSGAIALIEAGPGPQDLLTLRAVQRLQEADFIYYNGDLQQGALELARRDADRIAYGEADFETCIAQAIEAAKNGALISILVKNCQSTEGKTLAKSAKAAGLNFEIVPGIAADFGAQD